MPAKLHGSNGKMVPEYTTEEVQGWLDVQVLSIDDISLTLIVLFGVVGLCIFIFGLVQYMRENRDGASGGGGQNSHGLWMMLLGGALGSIDLIFIFIVAIVRPPGN